MSKNTLHVKLTPDNLPSVPVLKGDTLYDAARALAINAGALKADEFPAELHYERATKVWHAKN